MPRTIDPSKTSDWLVHIHEKFVTAYKIHPLDPTPCGEMRSGPSIIRVLDVPIDVPFYEVAQKTFLMDADPPLFFRPWKLVLSGQSRGQVLSAPEAGDYLGIGENAIKWSVQKGLLPSFRPRRDHLRGNRPLHFNSLDLDWFMANVYVSKGKTRKVILGGREVSGYEFMGHGP